MHHLLQVEFTCQIEECAGLVPGASELPKERRIRHGPDARGQPRRPDRFQRDSGLLDPVGGVAANLVDIAAAPAGQVDAAVVLYQKVMDDPDSEAGGRDLLLERAIAVSVRDIPKIQAGKVAPLGIVGGG